MINLKKELHKENVISNNDLDIIQNNFQNKYKDDDFNMEL